MKITTILIDDEQSAIENLSIILEEYCPEVQILATGTSVSEGIKLIKQYQPELVFSDISMPPEGTGFDVIEAFPNRTFHVVFITAYEEYSLKAIKSHAFDYILKPLDYKEVVQCIEHFKHFHRSNNSTEKPRRETLSISTTEGLRLLEKTDILYVKAEGSYVSIFLKNRESVLVSRTLKSVEEGISSDSFMRVHRSYVVNLSHINRFIRSNGGFLEIAGELIPVSDQFREKVISLFT